jgi:hypothetical protein
MINLFIQTIYKKLLTLILLLLAALRFTKQLNNNKLK